MFVTPVHFYVLQTSTTWSQTTHFTLEPILSYICDFCSKLPNNFFFLTLSFSHLAIFPVLFPTFTNSEC